jgi:hypothetical protein
MRQNAPCHQVVSIDGGLGGPVGGEGMTACACARYAGG